MFNDFVGTWLFDSLLTFLLFSFSVSLFSYRECIVFCLTDEVAAHHSLVRAALFRWCDVCACGSLVSVSLDRGPVDPGYRVPVWLVHTLARIAYTSFISLPFIRVHVWPHPIRFILPVVHFYMFIYGIIGSFISFLLFAFSSYHFRSVSRTRRSLHHLAIYIGSLCSLI